MTATDDYSDARHRLVTTLEDRGALSDSQWERAFLAAPRHVFVPRFTRRDQAGNLVTVDSRQRSEWLSAVYSDDALVTSRDANGIALSSSTQPFVMAIMLQALEVHSGLTVLEIGTGTGYNTALLCHALGADRVTSIEVDPVASGEARTALTSLDLQPTLVVGDGLQGYSENAPYDRIIATCSTRKVPAAWLEQIADNGVIVANIGFGLIALHVTPERVAIGQFHPQVTAFIEARPADSPPGLDINQLIAIVNREPDAVGQAENPELITSTDFEFLLRIVAPGLTWYTRLDDHGEVERWGAADATTGAWMTLDHSNGTTIVRQGGSRQLWPTIRGLYEDWNNAGRPTHDQYGLTITPDGTHRLWLIKPENEVYVLD